MTDEYVTEFVRESEDHIGDLNHALLSFENDPSDEEAMEQIFRSAHTLKGNFGAMGFDAASELAHAVEDLLESVRSDRVEVTPELMDAVFAGVDELEAMLEEVEAHGEVRSDPAGLIAKLREHADAPGLTAPTDQEVEQLIEQVGTPSESDHRVYHVRIEVAGDEASHGRAIVHALEDAFELLGTDPERSAVEAGEYDGAFDAVFASVVQRRAVQDALEPVGAVATHLVTDVTDRLDRDAAAAPGEASEEDVRASIEASDEEADDLSVDELLETDGVAQFDDLDELTEEVEDDGAFDDLGEAGSFDDLDLEADDVELPGEGDDGGAAADDAPIQDATREFEELKTEVDPVGFDELQEEIEELEFDEYDSDDEVGFDELLDEDALADDAPITPSEPGLSADDAAGGAGAEGGAPADAEEPAVGETDEPAAGEPEEPAASEPEEPVAGEADAAGGAATESADAAEADPTDVVEAESAEPATDAAPEPAPDDAAEPASDETPEPAPGEAADADAADVETAVADAADVDPAETDAADVEPADAGTASGAEQPAEAAGDADADAEAASAEDEAAGATAGADAEAAGSSEADAAADAQAADAGEADAGGMEVADDRADAAGADAAGADDAAPDADDAAAVSGEGDATAADLFGEDAVDAEEAEVAATPDDDADEGLSAADAADLEDDSFEDVDSFEAAEPQDVGPDASAAGEADDGGEAVEGFGDDTDLDLDGEARPVADEADADEATLGSEAGGVDADDGDLGADSAAADAEAGEADAATDDVGAPGDADSFADASADADSSGGVSVEEFDVDDDADADAAGDVAGPDDLDLGESGGGGLDVDDLDLGPDDGGDEGDLGTAGLAAPGEAVEDVGLADPVDEFGDPVVEDVDEDRLERVRQLGVPAADTDGDADEGASAAVRVDVAQLDRMLNLVEGLVTSRARLRRALEEGEPRQVLEDELDSLEDVTSELQDEVMDVRLVPLDRAVSRLPRTVRDIAREQDKQVDLEVVGEDVELDRSIVDEIGDPLVHLVRNAVDHGIEPPAERAEAGKDETGTIELRASRDRDRVRIVIEDDGRGVDPDDVRDAAVEDGDYDRETVDAMDDDAVLELLFESGFSTAEEVTDVSGRGVGMDVVADTVERLDGSVSVHSEVGEGTTVELELPVTLAIADVLFVRVGDEEYGVPVSAIDEVGPVAGVETQDGREVLVSDGGEEERELVRLRDALGATGPGPAGQGMLVHLRDDVREATLLVDAVRGQQEVVVKPFEGVLEDVPGLAGATVLGDGDVVTILEAETL